MLGSTSQSDVSRPFWLLIVLMGTGTLGMHAFVPALPLIGEDYGVGIGATQMTISVYMASLGVGQIIIGPISDRIGRRPALISGLLLYCVASVAAALAPSLSWLIVARSAQALGGCAGLVLGRAIVHDTSRDADAASTIAIMNSVQMISPAIAPMIGVWLAHAFGWRSVPLMLCLVGALALLGTVLRLSETHTPEPIPIRQLARRYGRLLIQPGFMAHVIGGSLTTTTLFTLLSTSPYIVTDYLGLPLSTVGYFYGMFVLGIMSGGLLANRLVRPVGFSRLILAATFTSALAGLALLTQVLAGVLTVPGFVAAGFLFTTMSGIMGPLALTKSVDDAGALKGSATGIYGFFQMGIGALCVAIASTGSDIELSAATVLSVAGASSFTIFLLSWLLRRR